MKKTDVSNLSKKDRKQLYTEVANELQDVFDIEPPFNTKTDGKSEASLKGWISQAASLTEEGDDISPKAVAVCHFLDIELPDSFDEVEEAEEVEAEEEDEKPAKAKKPAKKASKEKDGTKTPEAKPKAKSTRVPMEEKIAFFKPLITKAKSTPAELVEAGMKKFPQLTESAIRTFITDSKNPKYNKFEKLVVVNTKGNLSFKK